MKRLAALQREFLDEIFSDAVGPRAVYRRNALSNLHDALVAAYPVVRALVGKAFFREAADRFARAYPSRSGDLHRYGGELAVFLSGYAPASELPYLADVARLEWALAQAYHAADQRAFDFAALAALSESDRAQVSLALQPAAQIVASLYPVLSIWEANQAGRDGVVDSMDAGDAVLVYREGFQARARRLAPAERNFLEAVAKGRTLGEMARDAVIAPVLAGQLVKWTRAGVIDGFSTCPPRT